MGKKGQRRGGRKNAPAVDKTLANSIRPSGSGTTMVATDFTARRQNMNIVQTPPKNFINQIYWLKELTEVTFVTNTTVPVENNFAFGLNSLGDSGTLATIFDQYCLYSVAVSFSLDGSDPGIANSLVNIFTAIDYDSTANIGATGIKEFSTCTETNLTLATSLVRYVKPCLAQALYAGTVSTGYSTARCWVDSNSTNVGWFGLRSICAPTAVGRTVRVTFEQTYGFRSKW